MWLGKNVTTTVRVLGILLLLIAGGGLCVQYAAVDQWSYPSPQEIDSNPGEADGTRVLLFGIVQAIDPDDGQVSIQTGPNLEYRVLITDVPDSLTSQIKSGGAIQVFGTVGEGGDIVHADRIVVDFRDQADRSYTYLTSLLGGILASGYFLRHWQIDFRNLQFTPRDGS